MKERAKDLIAYRLEQADESITSAKLLLDQQLYRSSVNRSYYAMFYAALALLVVKKLKSSKHSGVIAMFNREFVKTGTVGKQYSKWYHQAFDLRQKTDYRELVTVSVEQAENVLQNAQAFVTEMKEVIGSERVNPREKGEQKNA